MSDATTGPQETPDLNEVIAELMDSLSYVDESTDPTAIAGDALDKLRPFTGGGWVSPERAAEQERAGTALVALSRWVDAGNADRDPEALTLHRVIKLTEESGEVVTALIGALGANPRKGVTNSMEKVRDELLDVAITALGAFEHLDSHQGRALSELASKIQRVATRAATYRAPLDGSSE